MKKKLFYITLIIAILCVISIFICDWTIKKNAASCIYTEISDIPANNVGDRKSVVFALPDDFLLLLWCSAKSYELLGRELRCFAGNCLEVLYISRSCVDALENNGVADLPAYFIECVVCKTSERLAVIVSGSMDKKLSLHKLYDVVLDEAKLVDVRQYASNGRVVAPLDAMMGVDGDFFPPTY